MDNLIVPHLLGFVWITNNVNVKKGYQLKFQEFVLTIFKFYIFSFKLINSVEETDVKLAG